MAVDYEALKKDLVETFGLDGMSAEQQEALLSKMGEALIKRIFLETMEKLGDEGVAEYEKLLDAGSKQEEIEAFFESKIPDYGVFVNNIVVDFKEEMKKGLA